MARKRMIDPHIWEDPSFNKLSLQARLLFIGMVSNADDHGYLRGDVGSLKRLVFGFDEIGKDQIQEWVNELMEINSLHFFQENDEWFAHFTKWDIHQKQREDRIQASSYPMCNKCQTSGGQVTAEVKLSKEKLINGESAEAPLLKKNETMKTNNGLTSVKDILNKKILATEQAGGIIYEWQEKALRTAEELGLILAPNAKGRWMKMFKQASEGRKSENIAKAYGYLKDHPRILSGEMSNEEKMLFFFKIYERGMEWIQNEQK